MQKCIDAAKTNMETNQYSLASAVVDSNGNIFALEISKLRAGNDPTSHPEICVIRESCSKLGSRTLKGCWLYTTLEPCPMCTSAAIWAKMKGIVYGASQEDAINFVKQNNSEFTWRQITVKASELIKNGEPKLELHQFMSKECNELFF